MAFVYKYQNIETRDIEYVGISRDYETFVKRIRAHKNDEWYKPFKYHVFYLEVPTLCDAHMLEGHFIDLYKSYEFYNKCKTEWGKCTYAPEYVEWKQYDESKGVRSNKGMSDVLAREYELKAEARMLEMKAVKFEEQAYWLKGQISELIKEKDALKRRSVRQWFRENYEVRFGLPEEAYIKSTSEELFGMYDDYLDSYDESAYSYTDRLSYSDIYDFQDSSEFWDTLLDLKELRPFICGDNMTYTLKQQEAI